MAKTMIKKTMKKVQLQQGDVTIWSTVLPSNAFMRNNLIVRKGEATGHAHRIKPSKNAQFKMLELGGRIFAQVLKGDVQVVHEEHDPITLTPLPPTHAYEFGPTFEYDHFTRRERTIVD